MPRGDKDKYTDKQKRQAEHIEEGYEKRGIKKAEAEARAWATGNKISGGGKAPGGSGRGKLENREPERRGGALGGAASAARPKSAESASAKKAARTRAKGATR
jgi:plasmid stabilization system protein ParE